MSLQPHELWPAGSLVSVRIWSGCISFPQEDRPSSGVELASFASLALADCSSPPGNTLKVLGCYTQKNTNHLVCSLNAEVDHEKRFYLL